MDDLFGTEEDLPTGQGLNAGAELEGEDPVVDILAPLEDIESVEPDVQNLMALEERLQDLVYVRADIERTHGMSQHFALEAARVLPDFDGGLPVGYYTKEPSATRYAISLEALSKGVWTIIAAAVVAVIALIAKFVGWFLKGEDKDPVKASASQAQKAKENEEVLKQTVRRTDDLSADVHNGEIQKTQEAGEPQRLTMATLIDDMWKDDHRYGRAKEFLAVSNPVYHDIIHLGPYTKAFRALTPALPALRDALDQKLQIIIHVSKLDKESFLTTQKSQNTRELELVGKPIEIGFQGGPMTLQEIADRLAAIRQQTVQKKTHGPMVLDDLVRSVAEAYRTSATVKFFTEQRDILSVMEKMEKTLQTMQAAAGKLSTDGDPGQNTDGVAAHLREVIFKVGRDIAGYNNLFGELRQYGAYLDRLARETVGFAEEVEQGIINLARRKKLIIPDDWGNRVERNRAARVEALFTFGTPKK